MKDKVKFFKTRQGYCNTIAIERIENNLCVEVFYTEEGDEIIFNFGIKTGIKDYNLRYDAAAARIMYSPQCYAYNTTYIREGATYHQVTPGVLDLNKIEDLNPIPETCIRGEKPMFINITTYDPSTTEVIESYYLWNHEMPTEDELKKWNEKSFLFKVIIKDGNKNYDGKQ